MEVCYKKMTNSQLMEYLQDIRNQLKEFSKIVRKYPRGHKYYKESSKKYRLELTGKLKRIRSLKSDKISEIDTALLSFLSMTPPSSKNCEDLVDKINYTLQELEIALEENQKDFIERIYDENSPFDFHNDIRDIIKSAKKEIFIVEPYIDEDLLEVTLRKVNNSIDIKILANIHNPKGKFVKVSNKFISQHKGKFEAKETDKIHDRGIFIDNKEGWVVGQSLKQGGKKPTYLIKLQNPRKLEAIYNKIWLSASKIK